MSTGRRIAQATVVVLLLNSLSKLSGFAREQMIAIFFGATARTDAYVMANRIPTLVLGFLSGPLSTAFLPVFAAAIAKGDRKAASRVVSSIVTMSTLIVAIVSVLAIVPAPALVRLIAPGFSGSTFDSAVLMTRIFFPAMLFPLLSAYAKQVLNTHGEFALPAVAPFVQNLVIIASIALFAPALGIPALAIGSVAGYVVNLVVQAPLWRKRGPWPGFSLRLDQTTRSVIALAIPLMAAALFSQAYLLVEGSLASRLPEGSIAALSFADRVRQVPLGLFVTALTTVVYPSLSTMWAKKNIAEFGDTAIMGLRYVAFICVPAAAGLMVLAGPTIRLAYRYGAFTSEAVSATAAALVAYAPGMIALGVASMTGIAFYSGHETRIPVALGVGTSVLTALLDLALVGPMGHVGLALANSLGSIAGAIAGLYVLSRFVGGLPNRSLLISLGKIAAASVPAAAVAFGLSRLTGFESGAGSFVTNVAGAAVTIGGAGLAYLVSAILLRCEEMTVVMGLAKDRFGSLSKKVRE